MGFKNFSIIFLIIVVLSGKLTGATNVNLSRSQIQKLTERLHSALERSNTENSMIRSKALREVKDVILAGANVNAIDEDGETALHIAVQLMLPDFETVVLLIEHGASLSAFSQLWYLNALDLVLRRAQAIADSDESLRFRPSPEEARRQYKSYMKTIMQIIRYMLLRDAHSADPERLHRGMFSSENRKKYIPDITPLMWAAITDDTTMVKNILSQQSPASVGPSTVVDINARDKNGLTALHWAAARGNLAIVKALLAHGANPTLLDSQGKTAYQLALMNGHMDIVDAITSYRYRGSTQALLSQMGLPQDIIKHIMSYNIDFPPSKK